MDTELFTLPPVPTPAMLRAMAKKQCVPILATALLVREASLAMRGDGLAAGPAVLIDAIPAFCALGVDHRARKSFQKLAGLVADGSIRDMRGDTVAGCKVPTLAMIGREAMARRADLAASLRAAAAAVEAFAWPSGDTI